MSLSSKGARVAPPPPNELQERKALVRRVLCSRQLEKSGRIRDFVNYVCERSFSDPEADIHEQEIGEQAFGRPEGYDTTQDNIVRVTASQARKKLESYFKTEGAAELLLLEVPKGQYVPVFRPRSLVVEPPRSPSFAWTDRLSVIALSALCVVLGAVAIYLAVQLRGARLASAPALEASPNLNTLWSQILPSGSRTDLVVTDSSLSFFQELLNRQLTLAEYLNPESWMKGANLEHNPELQAFAARAARHRFTSLANVTFAYRLARLGGQRLSIFSARDFNIRQMQSDNVILLGSTRANPWLELVAERLNFSYGFDQTLRYSYFANRNPKPGEAKLYRSDANTSFCQIAFTPNLGRTGNILVIAGTEVEGTEGGGEFLTNERSMGQLRSALPGGTNGKLPHFEVLLKSSRVGGVAPRFELLSARVIK